jgi:hypothetical protein
MHGEESNETRQAQRLRWVKGEKEGGENELQNGGCTKIRCFNRKSMTRRRKIRSAPSCVDLGPCRKKKQNMRFEACCCSFAFVSLQKHQC